MLHGIGVSRGVARGVVYLERPFEPTICRAQCGPDQRPAQAEAYCAARAAAAAGLEALIDALQKRGAGQGDIFAAHQEILMDEAMEEEILEAICQQGATAGAAVDDVYRAYAGRIARAKDPVIRERAKDLDDVRLRLLRALEGKSDPALDTRNGPCIAVAEEWLPSQIARLAAGAVAGVASLRGTATCHAAIVCQAMGLPALFGVPELLDQARAGMRAVLDAEEGTLLLEPDEAQWAGAGEREQRARQQAETARRYARQPAVTTDGCPVEICLNAGAAQLPPEIAFCDGVGLFRTEFLFMEQKHLPDEEEQYQAYSAVLRQAAGKPVILRTLDIGADKQLEYYPLPKEDNPALGMRALRLCLDRPELFRTQLRAAWRASAHGSLWMMFPMVAGLEDWRRAKAFCLSVREELVEQGCAVGDKVPLGAMIEIPSAALDADRLAGEVDFASVGTNDLCQYLFAADRTNARVAQYAPGHSPVLMRLMGHMAQAFAARAKPLSVCGELGGDARAAAVLVGLGYRKLSMSPANMPFVRQVICRAGLEELQQLARRVCVAADLQQAEEEMQRFYQALIQPAEKGDAECTQE